MEIPLYRKKCLQCHVKAMFTNHQKAETKKYLSFVTYIYEISSEEQQRLKALVNLDINDIEEINYLPLVQHNCSFAWDQIVNIVECLTFILNFEHACLYK